MGDRTDAEAPARQGAAASGGAEQGPPWRGALAIVGFSLYPFADFLLANRLQGVTAWQLAPYASAVLGVGLVVLLVAWRVRGPVSAERVAIAYAAGIFATFAFGGLSAGLGGRGLVITGQVAVWMAVFLAVVIGASLASRVRAVRTWVAAFAVLLVALPVLQLEFVDATPSPPAPTAQPTGGSFTTRPDIYYIVPDGYGRADLLEDDMDFDNSAFLAFLERQGFAVAGDALANATATFASVASTLAMDYLVEPGPDALPADESGTIDRRTFYDIIQGESATVRLLRDQGYAHVQAPPGQWSGSECSGSEDLCVEPLPIGGARMALDEVEWGLLRMTPAAAVLSGAGETFDGLAADPLHTLQQVQASGIDEPVFAFVHMLHPHPPFRLDERCRPVAADRMLERWDEEARTAYVAGVRCTNRRLRAFVEALPATAIVVIQADHGPNFLGGAGTPIGEWTDEQVVERLSILSAIRLPRDCEDLTDGSHTGVNTFRVVTACLEGREPDLLPDRQLLVPYRGTEVVEVDVRSTGQR